MPFKVKTFVDLLVKEKIPLIEIDPRKEGGMGQEQKLALNLFGVYLKFYRFIFSFF